jgi:Family of unknown function (DUF5309)
MAASTTLEVASNILKEVYEPRLRDQLQSDVITLKRIESSSEGVTDDVGGKYVVFPIRTRRNHGIGARLENEPLPRPKSQKHATARVGLSYQYGSASLTGQVIRLASTNAQAFVSALDQEMSGLKQTLVKDQNRQTYGSFTGVMATIPAGSASAGFTHTVASAQYLEPGMVVDVLDSTGAVARAVEIEIVGITGLVVTFSSSFDSTNGDIITRSRSFGKEKIGFADMVSDTSTLFGISPAVEPVWKAVVSANGGTPRALSEGLMTRMTDDIRTNGGNTTVIFTTPGVRRAYANLLQQQRRYVNTAEFAGGFKGLEFVTDSGPIPLMSDPDCPPRKMHYLNEKEIKLYEVGDWEFMDMDGSKWQRVITAEGKFDAYEATMFKYLNMGTHRRNSHGLLDDVQEAS